MKRKKTGVIPAEATGLPIVAPRTRAILPHKTIKRGKCVICGGAVAPFSTEALCWVCRRLKISAWRESESQPSIQD